MLDNKSAIIVTSLIKAYYQKISNFAPKSIEKREFGFGDFEKKIVYRHYSFRGENELKDYLVKNAPPFVSVSSAEYEKPAGRPMESKKWLGSDLVFDLDANDLNLKCRLEHGGLWVCENCLSAVKKETLKLIEEFLIPDFGFSENDIRINFSGNRGYHVHVANDKIFPLDGKARDEIVKYVTATDIELGIFFPTLGRRGVRLEGPKPTDYGWGGKFANAVIKALNNGTNELMELGIDSKSASLLVRKRAEIILGITTGNWDKIKIPKKAEFWSSVLKRVAISQSESIDKNVTKDIYHILRLPDTIHGDTGLLAKRVRSINALEDFDPMKEAIAFKDGTIKIKTLKVLQFLMNGKEFGPYESQELELPTYSAVYLLLKRLAIPSNNK